jgi:DNA topoisomerase IA
MKNELIKELSKADEMTIKNMYGVFKIVRQNKNFPGWNELSDTQKEKIDAGLQQLKEGKGLDALKVTSALRKKYGIKS